MSKLSFRARALDPSKPMPIYLAEELPDLPEYSAINRAVPQMPSGMEKEEESEHHLQRAICTGLIIPTPEVFSTDKEFYDRNYPPNYKMPRQLIHMQPLGLEQDIPDYDMDSADEMWVNSQPKRLNLTPLKFEQMMDRLEKSSGQTVVTLNEAKALLKEDDEISIAVYDYWLNKRLKLQHPLLLSVKTENRSGAAANNPYLAFRRRTEKMQTRKNRKNDETSYEKMLKLRRDLSRAVTLLEMIKRREKTKREQVHLTIEIFEKRFYVKDFNGAILAEISSSIKSSRPAFAPLYSNQYSHHSSIPQTGIISSSSTGHHYSSQQYLNSTGVVTPSPASGAIKRDVDSGNKKEKRQYKKRKHKMQREKQYPVQINSPAAVESTIESEEEDLGNSHLAGSEGEDEGLYAFKRNKNCEYHKPLTKELGNWPWESKLENGLADPRYRFTLTSIRHPRRRCIGFARRRVGRGGRIILDRMSTNMDDLWSELDYTIFDNSKKTITSAATKAATAAAAESIAANETTCPVKLEIEEEADDENISRDSDYLSASTEPIKHSKLQWNNADKYRNLASPPITSTIVTNLYKNNNNYNNNKGLNNLSSSNVENNSISNISNYLLNKEIKREQLDVDDFSADWTNNFQQQQLQLPNQSQSDIVVDLVRTHCKNNSSINNRSLNNNINSNNNSSLSADNSIRTTYINANCNENMNVIKTENLSIVKQDNDTATDLNILDDENMNLARLSSFINATKHTAAAASLLSSSSLSPSPSPSSSSTTTGGLTGTAGLASSTYIKSELPRTGSLDLVIGSSSRPPPPYTNYNNNNNYNVNNNCNKLYKSSSLPQDILYDSVKSEDKRTDILDAVGITAINNNTTNNNVFDVHNIISDEFLDEIRKDWLHFRPKTPENGEDVNEARKDTLLSGGGNCVINEETAVDFSEQTPIVVEMQQLGTSSPPPTSSSSSSVFLSKYDSDPTFVTNSFAFSDLLADDQLLNTITSNSTDSSSSGIDFNLSGDSLNELNISLCEEDNEKILDNILQECQIDDIKTLNQTTNFWNGILDDGGLLDVIDEKKAPVTDVKDFLNSGCTEDKECKKSGKRKSSIRYRIGNSSFSVSNCSKEDSFFRKEESKSDINQSIKIEPPEEILASPPPPPPPSSSSATVALSSSSSSRISSILSSSLSSSLLSSTSGQQNVVSTNNITDYHHHHPTTQGVTITQGMMPTTSAIGSTNQSTILTNINPNKILIKQESNIVPSNMSATQNAVITLSNVKLDNDITSSTGALLTTHTGSSGGIGTAIADAGSGEISGSMSCSAQQQQSQHQQQQQQQQQQQSSLILTPKQQQQQQQHILVQQITQNPQAQIIVSNAGGLSVNDTGGTIVQLAVGSSPPKRQINGPTDRNAIQNILKQTKFINRKFHLSQQQAGTIQTIKQEDDGTLISSANTKTATQQQQQQQQQQHQQQQQLQQSGNYIKMSPYPVVVSEINVSQQNSLSASAVTVASNHNYSLQPTAGQQITIIGQQQQGNKIILNTSGSAGTISAAGGSGNLTIPIQDIQNKLHYNQIPTSNIKVNLVTSGAIQQGSLIVDPKNTVTSTGTSQQMTHTTLATTPQQQIQQQPQQQQQQRIKLEKTFNMYIDPEQKRVLYTKLINLASLQNKNSGQTQTVQVAPGTAQILNKTHTVQRLANAQAIVTNMRSLPVSNQIATSAAAAAASGGGSVNAILSTGGGGNGGGVSGNGTGITGSGSNDISHKQQNSNSNDTLTAANTVAGGINLNTTNR